MKPRLSTLILSTAIVAFLIALLIALGSTALGQNMGAVGSSIQAPFTNVIVIPDHPLHATQHAMGAEQSLYGSHLATFAQGERPLWEFGDNKVERPLGDIAREYRDAWMHPQKKAIVTLEK